MTRNFLFTRSQEAAEVLLAQIGESPEAAIVLGSGLGGLADAVVDAVTIPYASIPHFPVPSVSGHRGNLIVGSLAGVRVAMFQGRFHFYEGHELSVVTFPIRVLQRLGVPRLILTAATGGIREDLRPGDLLCLTDHLNLLGTNPLRGCNDERLGAHFPDMTEVYSPRLRTLAHQVAEDCGQRLKEGIYACLPGPSYETPAEIRMLRTLGADVVGMSTVPEAVVAHHAGIEVLAFALVSNMAAGVLGTPITHEEVLEAGREGGPRLGRIIEGVVGRLKRPA